MKKSPAKLRLLAAALAGASLLGATSSALATGVSIVSLNDAFGLFGTPNPVSDPTGLTLFTTPAPTGTGPTVFQATSFDGTGSTFGGLSVTYDTLAVTFKADAGFMIKDVSYAETGKYIRQGLTSGTYAGGSVVVNGGAPITFDPVPHNAKETGDAPLTNWDAGVSSPIVVSVNGDMATITVTNILAAFSTPSGTSTPNLASIFKDLAAIHVNVTAVPLPPALWMLGSALVGLATVGRRKAQA